MLRKQRIALTVLAALALACVAPGVARAEGASPPAAVDEGIRFSFSAPGATTVHLAGEFNAWDPAALPMSDDDGDGVWEVVTELQAGRTYEYKFVVDGGVAWKEDPLNPHTVDDNHGGVNTVVSIDPDGALVLGPLGASLAPGEPVVDVLRAPVDIMPDKQGTQERNRVVDPAGHLDGLAAGRFRWFRRA